MPCYKSWLNMIYMKKKMSNKKFCHVNGPQIRILKRHSQTSITPQNGKELWPPHNVGYFIVGTRNRGYSVADVHGYTTVNTKTGRLKPPAILFPPKTPFYVPNSTTYMYTGRRAGSWNREVGARVLDRCCSTYCESWKWKYVYCLNIHCTYIQNKRAQ